MLAAAFSATTLMSRHSASGQVRSGDDESSYQFTPRVMGMPRQCRVIYPIEAKFTRSSIGTLIKRMRTPTGTLT